MSKIGYIYNITNPTGKIYIGKTTTLNDINYHHIHTQRLLYNLIKKYVWENLNFTIIKESLSDYLTQLKIVLYYNTYYYNILKCLKWVKSHFLGYKWRYKKDMKNE